MNVKTEHAALVLLCECPRKDEKTHLHHQPTGETREVEMPADVMAKLGQRGQKLQVPITEPVMVQGGVPRIVLRPDGEPRPSRQPGGSAIAYDEGWERRYAGACSRCGEVFSCTLGVFEAGLREPAPPAKEEADGAAERTGDDAGRDGAVG